jgi:hypothetical protein
MVRDRPGLPRNESNALDAYHQAEESVFISGKHIL